MIQQIREFLGKIALFFLPYIVQWQYREQGHYLKDNGEPHISHIPYQDFYNSYLKQLNNWIKTGQKEP